MFGYWKKLRELEEQNRDLNERLEAVEEYVHRQDVFKLLKKYSEKYGLEIELRQDLYSKRYYLDTKDGKTICLLNCFNGMADVYSEIERCESKIKAFMYDRIKDAVAEAAEKEGEKANDKE